MLEVMGQLFADFIPEMNLLLEPEAREAALVAMRELARSYRLRPAAHPQLLGPGPERGAGRGA